MKMIPILALGLLLLDVTVTSVLASNELRINTAEGFKSFVNSVPSGKSYEGSTVYLDSDIDFSGESLKPIGLEGYTIFLGTFDGLGHVISNLTVKSKTGKYSGLFEYSEGLTIKNVVMDSSYSADNPKTTSTSFVGGIIGSCKTEKGPCIFENIVNMGNVISSGAVSSFLNVGGIAGIVMPSNYNTNIKNCANYGDIILSGAVTGDSYIGGIIGLYEGSSHRIHIKNCMNSGMISYSGTKRIEIGGIAGRISTGVIENCLSTGENTIGDNNYVGSILSHTGVYTEIVHCFWTQDINACNNTNAFGSYNLTGSSSFITPDSAAIDKMNEYAEKNDNWNKWVLNTDKKQISFVINDGKSFTSSSQIILLPNITENGDNRFSGWFTDSLWHI